MTPMRFQDKEDYLELHLVTVEQEDLPSNADAYMTVNVYSSGFEGHNDLWVSGDALCAFCKALITLEKMRQGEAMLEAVSPGELDIKVCSVSSGGHMAVIGSTAYEVQREHGVLPHSIRFGFEFEPAQLVEAINLSWVKKYGG